MLTVRTRIKICGVRRESDIEAAADAGADAVGFVFHSASPRGVSLDTASKLAGRLPPFVTPVGLFVDAPVETVQAALRAIPGLLLQFHGDESPVSCDTWQRPYLKAVRMTRGLDLLDFSARFARAAGLVLDTDAAQFGGSGKVFDWSLIPPGVPRPVVLSGGLHAANVIRAIEQVRPWAVDVSSGVESTRGVKDAALIRQFCDAVREADSRIADTTA